jgi:multidrug transporter EmrE-like cation transporter
MAILIVLSVLLTTGAQIILKMGMSSARIQQALQAGSPADAVLSIALSPWILAGLGCFGLSVVLWLLVLSRVDVSQAYPCVAFGFVLTMLAGHYLFGEPLGLLRVGGLALILLGVLVVAIS